LVSPTQQREEAPGGLLGRRLRRAASLEIAYPLFQLGKLRLRALEEAPLHVEIFARHELQAIEPARKHGPYVFLDIGDRAALQNAPDAFVQFVDEPLIHDGQPYHRTSHQLRALIAIARTRLGREDD
jgi:hypothetical protein